MAVVGNANAAFKIRKILLIFNPYSYNIIKTIKQYLACSSKLFLNTFCNTVHLSSTEIAILP